MTSGCVNRSGAGVRCRSLAASLSLALTLASSGSVADLRVLLAFDNDGYRVTRVMRDEPLPGAPAKRLGRDLRSSPFTVPIAPIYGEIELVWIDRDERVLATRRAPDPRITHPVGRAGETTRRVALARGAWLASGPDEAVTLLLRLPARAALALPAAQWRFDLEAVPFPTRRRSGGTGRGPRRRRTSRLAAN